MHHESPRWRHPGSYRIADLIGHSRKMTPTVAPGLHALHLFLSPLLMQLNQKFTGEILFVQADLDFTPGISFWKARTSNPTLKLKQRSMG